MKKLLAFLLALTLMMSAGVAAFADTYNEGTDSTQSHTQTITVNAPALTWTLESPASLEIEFGNTDQIEMGQVRLSDIPPSWTTLPENNFIYVTMAYNGELSSTTSNSTIAYDLYGSVHDWNNSDVEMRGSFDKPGGDGRPVAYYHSNIYKRWSDTYIQISEKKWQTAVPGEKYTGTITYSSRYGTL